MSKYVVINPDGSYAGRLCHSIYEAWDLAAQQPGRVVGVITETLAVEHIHCPVNGWDCPYYKNGICQLENPYDECDDFASSYNKYDEWICEGDEDCAIWDIGAK